MELLVRGCKVRIRSVKMLVAEEPHRVAVEHQVSSDALEGTLGFVLGVREVTGNKVALLYTLGKWLVALVVLYNFCS